MLIFFSERCGCAPPKAELRLNKTIKNAEEIWNSKPLIQYPINLEHSCSPTGQMLFYNWKVSSIDGETGYFGPLRDFGEKNTLILPLRFLSLGYTYIQCVVEIKGDAGSMTFDYGYLKIVRAPLVAKITDITRGSEIFTTIKLSARNSFDAERRSDGSLRLQFTWFCRLEDETFSDSMEKVVDAAFGRNKSQHGCFGFGPGKLTSRDEVLVLNRAEMVKSQKYIFTLVVYKDVRNSSAVYEYDVRSQVSIFVR